LPINVFTIESSLTYSSWLYILAFQGSPGTSRP